MSRTKSHTPGPWTTAAPDLLAALVDAADLMERRGQDMLSDGSPSACYERMLAAIARARGES